MINFILWVMVVGVTGWVASLVIAAGGQWGIGLKLIVGLLGATLADWFLSPVVGLPTVNASMFNVEELLVSLMGAVVLLTVARVFYRGPSVH